MKATIIRPDGTRIEAEGTPEEVARLAPLPTRPLVPFFVHCSCGMTTLPCPVHGYDRWTGPVIYGVITNMTYSTLDADSGNAITLTNGECC